MGLDLFYQLAEVGLSTRQQLALTAQEITRQGYLLAANEIFWLSGWLFLLLIVIVWLAKPPFRPGAGNDGGAH